MRSPREFPKRGPVPNSPYCAQAQSLRRPLRRLALSMALPALFDIRCRNPWFFARRLLFGWNVRFISTPARASRACEPRSGPRNKVRKREWTEPQTPLALPFVAMLRARRPRHHRPTTGLRGARRGVVVVPCSLRQLPGGPSDAVPPLSSRGSWKAAVGEISTSSVHSLWRTLWIARGTGGRKCR